MNFNDNLSSTKATIIIAAYNEESVISKTLQALTSEDESDPYQILVICNGCTDKTHQIIKKNFKNVHCHSITKASKSLAIRYAEALKPGFPRIYLDADIKLKAQDATYLFKLASQQQSAALVVPASKLNTHQSSTLVKSFYRAWYKTSHIKESGYAAGIYLINELGRKRFGEWPELTADDTFARKQFAKHEIHIDDSISVEVRAPKSIWSLIKIKSRSKFGNLELQSHENINFNKTHQPTKYSLRQQLRTMKWYDAISYVTINFIALCIAKWQFNRGSKLWLRDTSNH